MTASLKPLFTIFPVVDESVNLVNWWSSNRERELARSVPPSTLLTQILPVEDFTSLEWRIIPELRKPQGHNMLWIMANPRFLPSIKAVQFLVGQFQDIFIEVVDDVNYKSVYYIHTTVTPRRLMHSFEILHRDEQFSNLAIPTDAMRLLLDWHLINPSSLYQTIISRMLSNNTPVFTHVLLSQPVLSALLLSSLQRAPLYPRFKQMKTFLGNEFIISMKNTDVILYQLKYVSVASIPNLPTLVSFFANYQLLKYVPNVPGFTIQESDEDLINRLQFNRRFLQSNLFYGTPNLNYMNLLYHTAPISQALGTPAHYREDQTLVYVWFYFDEPYEYIRLQQSLILQGFDNIAVRNIVFTSSIMAYAVLSSELARFYRTQPTLAQQMELHVYYLEPTWNYAEQIQHNVARHRVTDSTAKTLWVMVNNLSPAMRSVLIPPVGMQAPIDQPRTCGTAIIEWLASTHMLTNYQLQMLVYASWADQQPHVGGWIPIIELNNDDQLRDGIEGLCAPIVYVNLLANTTSWQDIVNFQFPMIQTLFDSTLPIVQERRALLLRPTADGIHLRSMVCWASRMQSISLFIYYLTNLYETEARHPIFTYIGSLASPIFRNAQLPVLYSPWNVHFPILRVTQANIDQAVRMIQTIVYCKTPYEVMEFVNNNASTLEYDDSPNDRPFVIRVNHPPSPRPWIHVLPEESQANVELMREIDTVVHAIYQVHAYSGRSALFNQQVFDEARLSAGTPHLAVITSSFLSLVDESMSHGILNQNVGSTPRMLYNTLLHYVGVWRSQFNILNKQPPTPLEISGANNTDILRSRIRLLQDTSDESMFHLPQIELEPYVIVDQSNALPSMWPSQTFFPCRLMGGFNEVLNVVDITNQTDSAALLPTTTLDAKLIEDLAAHFQKTINVITKAVASHIMDFGNIAQPMAAHITSLNLFARYLRRQAQKTTMYISSVNWPMLLSSNLKNPQRHLFHANKLLLVVLVSSSRTALTRYCTYLSLITFIDSRNMASSHRLVRALRSLLASQLEFEKQRIMLLRDHYVNVLRIEMAVVISSRSRIASKDNVTTESLLKAAQKIMSFYNLPSRSAKPEFAAVKTASSSFHTFDLPHLDLTFRNTRPIALSDFSSWQTRLDEIYKRNAILTTETLMLRPVGLPARGFSDLTAEARISEAIARARNKTSPESLLLSKLANPPASTSTSTNPPLSSTSVEVGTKRMLENPAETLTNKRVATASPIELEFVYMPMLDPETELSRLFGFKQAILASISTKTFKNLIIMFSLGSILKTDERVIQVLNLLYKCGARELVPFRGTEYRWKGLQPIPWKHYLINKLVVHLTRLLNRYEMLGALNKNNVHPTLLRFMKYFIDRFSESGSETNWGDILFIHYMELMRSTSDNFVLAETRTAQKTSSISLDKHQIWLKRYIEDYVNTEVATVSIKRDTFVKALNVVLKYESNKPKLRRLILESINFSFKPLPATDLVKYPAVHVDYPAKITQPSRFPSRGAILYQRIQPFSYKNANRFLKWRQKTDEIGRARPRSKAIQNEPLSGSGVCTGLNKLLYKTFLAQVHSVQPCSELSLLAIWRRCKDQLLLLYDFIQPRADGTNFLDHQSCLKWLRLTTAHPWQIVADIREITDFGSLAPSTTRLREEHETDAVLRILLRNFIDDAKMWVVIDTFDSDKLHSITTLKDTADLANAVTTAVVQVPSAVAQVPLVAEESTIGFIEPETSAIGEIDTFTEFDNMDLATFDQYVTYLDKMLASESAGVSEPSPLAVTTTSTSTSYQPGPSTPAPLQSPLPLEQIDTDEMLRAIHQQPQQTDNDLLAPDNDAWSVFFEQYNSESLEPNESLEVASNLTPLKAAQPTIGNLPSSITPPPQSPSWMSEFLLPFSEPFNKEVSETGDDTAQEAQEGNTEEFLRYLSGEGQ